MLCVSLIRRVETPQVVYYRGSPRIIHCKKLSASFTTQSRDSPHRLLRGVTAQVCCWSRGVSRSSANRLLGVIIHINCFSKSIPDLWLFAECKVIFQSEWNFQKSMQLNYSTHRKMSLLCLWYFTLKNVFSIRISFCKNQNFEKSSQPIWMKLLEKHAIQVFYTQKKLHCFVYNTLLFWTFLFISWNSANLFVQKSKFL